MSADDSALALLSEAERKEYWACLALRHTAKLGTRSVRRLLARFGSSLAAFEHPGQWREAEVGADKSAALASEAWRVPAREEWDAAKTLDGRIVLWTSPDYPERLRELPDAPPLVYTRGDPALLGGPSLAVVGKRKCSSEGLRAAAYFAEQLSRAGVTVVSGLALGVDQAAHRSALPHPGRTVAVLGTGVDVPYPATNLDLYQDIREQALLVSEFAPGTKASPHHFPIRNRLISGLSLGVLVVEAAPRSGSLITARLALEQNRAVYAVPGALGAPTAQGCQELIRQGAKPVFDVRDVLEDLLPLLCDAAVEPPAPVVSSVESVVTPVTEPGLADAPPPGRTARPAAHSTDPMRVKPSPPAKSFPEVDPHSPEGRVLSLLRQSSGKALSIDALDDALDLSSAQLSALLVRLEVKGRIRKLPGQYYALPEDAHGS